MKKILFLSVNYPPLLTAGSSRASRIVSRLPELGWAPLVVAPADIAWDEEGKNRLLSESGEFTGIYRTGELVDAVAFGPERTAQLVQGMSAAAPTGSPLRMITGLLPGVNLVSGWEKQAASVADGVISRHDPVDAIYAQGPPAAPLLLALELSKKHALPVLFDLVAPLETPSASGSRQSDAAQIEERILTSGHTIITPTRALKEYFLKKYFGKATHDDISIIPDFCEEAFAPKASGKHFSAGSPRVTVLMEHASGKELKLFFSALGRYMKLAGSFSLLPSVQVLGGDDREITKYTRKNIPDASVSVVRRLSGEDELESIRQCDLFGVVAGREGHAPFTVPERAVDALCMRKPLFFVGPEGPAARLAVDAGGFWAPLEDVEGVAQVLGSAFESIRNSPEKFSGGGMPEKLSASQSLNDLSKTLAYLLPI
ncbi:MAG: hypothetical protein K9G39_06350 [Chlorobium sp.]|nr:hypothetical protein [Chlorobium sp.]